MWRIYKLWTPTCLKSLIRTVPQFTEKEDQNNERKEWWKPEFNEFNGTGLHHSALLRKVKIVPFLNEEIKVEGGQLVPGHTAEPEFETGDSHALLGTPWFFSKVTWYNRPTARTTAGTQRTSQKLVAADGAVFSLLWCCLLLSARPVSILRPSYLHWQWWPPWTGPSRNGSPQPWPGLSSWSVCPPYSVREIKTWNHEVRMLRTVEESGASRE